MDVRRHLQIIESVRRVHIMLLHLNLLVLLFHLLEQLHAIIHLINRLHPRLI